MNQQQKYERLQAILKEMDGVVVGYSGGVDSTFLAKVARDALGDRAVIVTAISESLAPKELEDCRRFASQLGFEFRTVRTNELTNPHFRENSPLRCAYCKSELLDHLRKIADEEGIQSVVLGVNLDDLGDYRPGQTAAKEKGARFPLAEADLTKKDIRAISRSINIPSWDKPAFACLASRFPYGEEITPEKLKQIADAEQVLQKSGFKQYRVRYHRDVARIEVAPENMPRLLQMRERIVSEVKKFGFTYVTMDLIGFRSGSMNESLGKPSSDVAADEAIPSRMRSTRKPKSTAGIDPAKTYTLYCDGGSRGNPGPAAYGAVIKNTSRQTITSLSQFLGKTTNNVAEYQGLIAVLTKALDLGIERITVQMDSELIVRQINGQYRVRQPHLKPLHAKCKAILDTFNKWQVKYIPREQNREADRLVNQALDQHAVGK